MQYLIEVNPKQAEVLIKHVSNLYRNSFESVREIALLDEIALCKEYLSIEQYRFDDKLLVQWELPDEDMLYDMVIVSRTLLQVIEKTIVLVVENSSSMIELVISILWLDDRVRIAVKANLPETITLVVNDSPYAVFDYTNLNEILRQYYGAKAQVTVEHKQAWLITHIEYPLKDVAMY